VRSLEATLAADKKIFLATQHCAGVDEPRLNEIYHVGMVVNIVQSLKLPFGNIKVVVEVSSPAKSCRASRPKASCKSRYAYPAIPRRLRPEIEKAMH
jgi:ATP-dependent Lon protease